jgi:hypothetical protein
VLGASHEENGFDNDGEVDKWFDGVVSGDDDNDLIVVVVCDEDNDDVVVEDADSGDDDNDLIVAAVCDKDTDADVVVAADAGNNNDAGGICATVCVASSSSTPATSSSKVRCLGIGWGRVKCVCEMSW